MMGTWLCRLVPLHFYARFVSSGHHDGRDAVRQGSAHHPGEDGLPRPGYQGTPEEAGKRREGNEGGRENIGCPCSLNLKSLTTFHIPMLPPHLGKY